MDLTIFEMLRIEMPLFNAKFVAVHCSSTKIKITPAVLPENAHSSAAHVM